VCDGGRSDVNSSVMKQTYRLYYMSCKEVEREEERGIHVLCILDGMAASSSRVCSRFIKLIRLGMWGVSEW